jgi:hypothetical protein
MGKKQENQPMILRSIGVYRLYMDKKWGQAENAWI